MRGAPHHSPLETLSSLRAARLAALIFLSRYLSVCTQERVCTQLLRCTRPPVDAAPPPI